MILLARLISIILGIIVISKTYLDYKKQHSGIAVFLFWAVAWLAIITVSIYPIIIDKINNAVGDNTSGVTALFAMSFVFLFFVTYRVYTKANRLEQKLQDLVIKLGLKDIDTK
jgi:hypothetical protein